MIIKQQELEYKIQVLEYKIEYKIQVFEEELKELDIEQK